MGSGILGKFLRENVGKVHVPAGLTTTCKDPVRKLRRRPTEERGCAHEVVAAKTKGSCQRSQGSLGVWGAGPERTGSVERKPG